MANQLFNRIDDESQIGLRIIMRAWLGRGLLFLQDGKIDDRAALAELKVFPG
jgi:hypothetical protein